LRSQMQADMLQPLSSQAENVANVRGHLQDWSEETLQEVIEFLRMDALGRLVTVLEYLRDMHSYCFWCGTQYDSAEEMNELCPGPDENEHD